jgi:ppGpp synthetase/RelA/SpoT-type nucleotidyltranferase
MSALGKTYQQRYDAALKPLAEALELSLKGHFNAQPRIDRVNARAKSVDRFLAKAQATVDGQPKYAEPLRQIQDQIGARIITFYRSDVERVSEIVLKYYRPIENRALVPESEWEFGYFGQHFVLLIPSDVIDPSIDRTLMPQFFELQVKTLFQHAWSEANHDLGYKPGDIPLSSDAKRRLAFTSAQAWGADRIFDELLQERAIERHPKAVT